VPALALAEGAEPLCGSELELALDDGVLALAIVLLSVELLLVLDGDALLPRLADVVSGVPWIFTWWPRCADRLSVLFSFHMPPFLVARKKSPPCCVMQPSSVFSLPLLAVWVVLLALVVLSWLVLVLIELGELEVELDVSWLGVELIDPVLDPVLLLGVCVLLLLELVCATMRVANSTATSRTRIERIRIQHSWGEFFLETTE
jgi:hypothetical protein